MAIVDSDSGEIVLRILYEGPPLAGKTTSLEVLNQTLAAKRTSTLFSPAVAEGRTLYFDWLDYVGGWFEGHRVRCQIVSAPGQLSLFERRKLLLRDADVVVFVVESTADGLEVAADHYRRLKPFLEREDEPPVPIEFQANKQDLPGALTPEQIQELFSKEHHLAVLGSSAARAVGVREAFAFAVRLALDRVSILLKEGKLPVGEPAITDGEELLKWLAEEEGVAEDRPETLSAGEGSPRHSGSIGPAKQSNAPPMLPDVRAASEHVWPAMAGRIILQQLSSGTSRLWRRPNGGWVALAADRWWLFSSPHDGFSDLEEGRSQLAAAGLRYETFSALLSTHRALTLADAGDGTWRLWQIVRTERCIADSLLPARVRLKGGDTALQIFASADALLRAEDRFRENGAPFRATLRTLATADLAYRHIGPVPKVGMSPELEVNARPSEGSVVRREFSGPLQALVLENLIDMPRTLARLCRLQKQRPDRLEALEAIAAMLIGH